MEKVITMYDVSKMNVVGLIIVNEIELGYIDDKIVVYGDDNIKRGVSALISCFGKRCVNTRDFNKNLAQKEYGTKLIQNIHFLESFELKSGNKNKSSRYKRMLEHMNLSHLERFDLNVGNTKNN